MSGRCIQLDEGLLTCDWTGLEAEENSIVLNYLTNLVKMDEEGLYVLSKRWTSENMPKKGE